MPKFKARPKEIEAILISNRADLPDNLPIVYLDDFMVWNQLHDKWIHFDVPCWINSTNPFDLYPIHPDFMTANYELIDG